MKRIVEKPLLKPLINPFTGRITTVEELREYGLWKIAQIRKEAGLSELVNK